jgi:hypothetical protein
MISADIQALFDSIVVRHGGTDNLTRLDLEAVAAIVKMMIELRNTSAAATPSLRRRRRDNES